MSNNPAPEPLPLPEEVQQARDSMRQYFDDTVHPNDSYSVYCQLVDDLDTLELHIAAQARRLAEAEAENGRFAGMLESSVSYWRKLYTKERAERVRIQHILMDDVQDERQESDEHIKGLVTVIKTQDKNIGDLKAHIQRIEVDYDDVEARAEAAEARVRELEAEEEERKAGWQLAGDAARGLRVECDGDLGHEAEQIRSERDALRERCEKLERVREYAQHKNDCLGGLPDSRGRIMPCTCGRNAALAATEAK